MRHTVFFVLALSAGVINGQAVVRQLQSTVPQLRDAGIQACISAAENADGAAVIIHNCNTEDLAKHSWTVTPWAPSWNPAQPATPGGPAPMTIFGDKCIDVKDGINTDGAKLQIWTCSPGNTNQLWISQTDGTWNWAGTNKCIDLTDGNISDGNQLQLWTCSDNPSRGNQDFENAVPPNNRADERLYWHGGVGVTLCITATSNADGAPVVLDSCVNEGVRLFPDGDQFWTTAKDPLSGPFKVFDDTKCLDVPNGDSSNGNKLQIWSCVDGSRNQQFKIPPGQQTITWFGENKCVQPTNGEYTQGNTIEIRDCDGDSTQIWLS